MYYYKGYTYEFYPKVINEIVITKTYLSKAAFSDCSKDLKVVEIDWNDK